MTQVNSPFVFSLEGESGVCVDRVKFTTNECSYRGLSWGDQENRVFYDSLGQLTNVPEQNEPPVGEYVPSSSASGSTFPEIKDLAHQLAG